LDTRGVRQIVAASPGAEVRFRDPDGHPAIFRVPLGAGAVHCVASSLEPRGYARLLDLLFTEAGVTRPVRVRADSKWQIEARFAQSGTRRLLYITNFNSKPAMLAIDTGAATIRSLHELRDDRVLAGNHVTVPARQTMIYELF
jgi:hypothetical protein